MDGVVADVLALFRFALAGVVELGLEAGEAGLRLRELQGKLVAFGTKLLELAGGFGVLGDRVDVGLRGLVDLFRSICWCSWCLPFCFGSFAASAGNDLWSEAWAPLDRVARRARRSRFRFRDPCRRFGAIGDIDAAGLRPPIHRAQGCWPTA